jgi:hypothetical protein
MLAKSTLRTVPMAISIVPDTVTTESRFVIMLMTRAVATSPLNVLAQNAETIADGQQRASTVPA